MANNPKYFIVEASALPEVFLKVAEAKQLLATGQVSTVNEAAKQTGISRSAFYKYRDAVQPFRDMSNSRIITFQFLLRDEPGALSAILAAFAQHKANLMTINSIAPSNGCAVVTISAETMDLTVQLGDLVDGTAKLLTLRDVGNGAVKLADGATEGVLVSAVYEAEAFHFHREHNVYSHRRCRFQRYHTFFYSTPIC